MLGLAYLSVLGAIFSIFMAISPLWLRLCGRSRRLGTLNLVVGIAQVLMLPLSSFGFEVFCRSAMPSLATIVPESLWKLVYLPTTGTALAYIAIGIRSRRKHAATPPHTSTEPRL